MSAKELIIRKWMMDTVAVGVVLSLFSGIGANPQVPCCFIFGDSLVDNGNNNVLQSLARAEYPPYGIDFKGGPTGRFSNGKTNVDVIAELLGFDDYIPPYATARGQDMLKGVNYASAAAGIREETGQHLGMRMSFSGQVQNHQNRVSQIVEILGDKKSAAKYLSKCLYSIGMGSNDYVNNYFMPQFYSSSRLFSPVEYADVLIESYAQKLRCLYSYGARNMVLFGIGQIGCSPNELAQNSQDGTTCVERINSTNQIFNNRLKSLVDQLNKQLSHARSLTLVLRGRKKPNHGQITCSPMQIPCENRREYLFWDAYHPTEAVNAIIGSRAYSAQSASDAYPIDIRRLAQI